MNRLRRLLVWLSRIHQCRGFGIQSPSDYAFVRYVVNEHWPYYAYDVLPPDDWQRRKLGRLYFRLANWRQPSAMQPDDYQPYWQAGCRKLRFLPDIAKVELGRVDIDDHKGYEALLTKCDEQSVVVVENQNATNNLLLSWRISAATGPVGTRWNATPVAVRRLTSIIVV